ncbi:nudix (nucleoside diphosphate linked moiety X)-type motif 2, partial [Nowakowskiella sp. JEL0078]
RHWSPPKGRLIGNENELKCAIRETIDVTGLSLKDLIVESEETFRTEIKYLSGNGRPKRVVFFLAQVSQHGRILPPGLAGLHFAWLPLRQAQEKAVFKSMQDVLKQAHLFIEDKRLQSIIKPMAAIMLSSPAQTMRKLSDPPLIRESDGLRNESVDKKTEKVSGEWKKREPLGRDLEQQNNIDLKKQPVHDNQLFKTRLCERFETDGFCPYGNRCTFAHGTVELRDRSTYGGEAEKKDAVENLLYKTRLCERFMKENFCQYGPRCNFAHSLRELRDRPNFAKEDDEIISDEDAPKTEYRKLQSQSIKAVVRERSWEKSEKIETETKKFEKDDSNTIIEFKEDGGWKKKSETLEGAGITLRVQSGNRSRGVSPNEDKIQAKARNDKVSLQELMKGAD